MSQKNKYDVIVVKDDGYPLCPLYPILNIPPPKIVKPFVNVIRERDVQYSNTKLPKKIIMRRRTNNKKIKII